MTVAGKDSFLSCTLWAGAGTVMIRCKTKITENEYSRILFRDMASGLTPAFFMGRMLLWLSIVWYTAIFMPNPAIEQNGSPAANQQCLSLEKLTVNDTPSVPLSSK